MFTPQTEIIVSRNGEVLFRQIVTPGDYVIGREDGTDVRIDVPLVSRQHAKLTVNYSEMFIQDLGSANGTLLNGESVTEITRIWPSQKIQIGEATIETRRIKAASDSDASLPPEMAAVRKLLPEEVTGDQKYQIGNVVAQGGMGAILNARDAAISRSVAMKVMLQSGSGEDAVRFVEEAKITGQLEHPNIVPVHELSVDEHGQPFYTMKFVRGITLKGVLEEVKEGVPDTVAKYPLGSLLTVFQKICDAIAFAHSKGVIHRDLKPENIMIGDYGEVLVMDWGLAKVLGTQTENVKDNSHVQSVRGEGSVTMTGTIMGTPRYMAPEQARGEIESLDVRTDIYSLGAILFELLFLRPPVTGRSLGETVDKVGRGDLDWTAPTQLAPESLLAVCRKALCLKPDDRYPKVEDLQSEITAFQNGFATTAEKAGLTKQLVLLVKRHRGVSVATAAAFLLVAGLSVGFTIKVVGERNRTAQALERAESTLHELRGTAPTFVAQAHALVDEGKLEEALEKISYATGLDPKNPDHHLRRANYLQALQRLLEAESEYREVLALRPNDLNAQKNLSICENLRAENGGGSSLTKEQQRQLLDALMTQDRALEAIPLAVLLGDANATTFAELKAKLKPYMAQPGWKSSRLQRMPNDKLKLDLSNLVPGDLSVLVEFPIADLNLNGMGLTQIPDLIRLPLQRLTLTGNQFTDLSPLRGLPLKALTLNGTGVSDLGPLAGMPLDTLRVAGCPVADLTPLLGMPLRVLEASRNRIRDIGSLTGMPLEDLDLASNLIESIEPLRGAPLKRFVGGDQFNGMDASLFAASPALEEILLSSLTYNVESLRELPKLQHIGILGIHKQSIRAREFWLAYRSDWCAPGLLLHQIEEAGVKRGPRTSIKRSPDGTLRVDLANTKLDRLDYFKSFRVAYLDICNTKVRDLSPLEAQPLTWLRIDRTEVTDVRPLLTCPKLAILCLPRKAENVESLRQLPGLRHVSYEWVESKGEPAHTVAEFWKEFDSKKPPARN